MDCQLSTGSLYNYWAEPEVVTHIQDFKPGRIHLIQALLTIHQSCHCVQCSESNTILLTKNFNLTLGFLCCNITPPVHLVQTAYRTTPAFTRLSVPNLARDSVKQHTTHACVKHWFDLCTRLLDKDTVTWNALICGVSPGQSQPINCSIFGFIQILDTVPTYTLDIVLILLISWGSTVTTPI